MKKETTKISLKHPRRRCVHLYKFCDVFSSNLIGSLYLANGQDVGNSVVE